MQDFSLGAGLAAMAFWIFIASTIVAGIWFEIRKREAEQETVRRIVESGKAIDAQVLEKIIELNGHSNENPAANFRITALWILPVAVGLAVLGIILGMQIPQAKLPILAASALTACLGIGFWLASQYLRRQ